MRASGELFNLAYTHAYIEVAEASLSAQFNCTVNLVTAPTKFHGDETPRIP